MKTPESPLDLDSLLQTPLDTATEPPAPAVSSSAVFGAPLVEPPPSHEFSWDNEEILDIPRASSSSGQNAEAPLALDDLLSTPATSGEVLESYSAPPPMTASSELSGATGAAAYDHLFGQEAGQLPVSELSFSDAPRDYSTAGAEATGAEPARSSVFAQDSYVRDASNTYVMATPDQGNKGRLAKVFLAAALGFGLLGIGYFALSGLVKDWLGLRKQVASSSPAPATSRTTSSVSAPSAVPSASVATTSGKTASPSVAASAAATASAKPAVSATATPTPAAASKPSPPASPAVASKPTPAPATGSSGHAVGASDGSLAVQVASFKSPGEAQQALSRLKSAGVEARVVKAEVPGMGTRFRVQAGRFTNETEASKYAGELRAKGVARDFIVTGYQHQ